MHGHLEDVDLAGAAGGLRHLGHRLTEEGVQHAALAHVGTPQKSDLWQVRLHFKHNDADGKRSSNTP